jgi:hypothetical protein
MRRLAFGMRPLAGLIAALSLAFGYAVAPPPAIAADPPLPAWDGSVDLYRDGVFTTQKNWLWCTAAGVQIVRNIVDEQDDHTVSGQRRYFNWMRERNRYALPLSAGVDPQGWTAGLRQFVDDRYRLVTSTTFDNALRSAVKRLRLTGLPVALAVAHGNHGWILTGFAATEDPARTASFKVTSVRIVGPLYGLQSRNGYDMPPDTKLTPTQLKRYFTPWKYPPKAMIWDGRYVSIQPVPETAAASAAAPVASAGAVAGSSAPPNDPSPAAAPSRADEAEDVGSGAPGAAEVRPIPSIAGSETATASPPGQTSGPLVSAMAVVALAVLSVMIAVVLLARMAGPGTRRQGACPRLRARG